ncbi:hypothetical protein [Methylovorus sp. MM2]|nr:hypothetical protein [Methylovorus sp. MM2]
MRFKFEVTTPNGTLKGYRFADSLSQVSGWLWKLRPNAICVHVKKVTA